jgi:glutamate racemase
MNTRVPGTKIGFFDSGLGGLMILKAVRTHLPQYDYVYFGDTANVPYGNKTERQVQALTRAGIEKLFDLGAELIIVACNSASAESLRMLQDTMVHERYPEKRVLGVIIPTIEALVDSGAREVLLIATTRTVESQKYERELSKLSDAIHVRSVATPTLVPLIEAHELDAAFAEVKKAIDPSVGEIDTLVLGCTHYTLLKEALREAYNIRVISQDEIIPEKLAEYLERHREIDKRLTQGRGVEIVLSAESVQYEKIKNDFLDV